MNVSVKNWFSFILTDRLATATAVVLFVAAFLKLSTNSSSEPFAGFRIGLIIVELTLGLWLCCGVGRALARSFSLALFSVFATVTFYEAVSGDKSCGCFGVIAVNPWVTLALDLVFLLLWTRNRPLVTASRRECVLRCISLVALISIPSVAALLPHREHGIRQIGAVALIDPAAMLGHKLPLFRYMDIENSVTRGRWLMVFRNSTCASCKKLIDDSQQLELLRKKHTALGIAYIQVDRDSLTGNSHSIRAQLDPSRMWILETPLILLLEDSRLIQILSTLNDQDAPQIVETLQDPASILSPNIREQRDLGPI